MADKKAFVFDTNFIIQKKQLDEALEQLKDDFSVYVTQVSIDERIAQNCRELKANFDEVEQCKKKFSHFVTINFKKTYEEECEFYEKGIQEKYESYFGNHIIPFSKDEKTISEIIDRANKRIPPFSADPNASDKGFKDCLLWISMLSYFKKNGEDEVVFVTDDRSAFRKNTQVLQIEFKEITNKTIEIHPNSYYNELLKQSKETTHILEPKPDIIPNIDVLRDEIEEVIESLRVVEIHYQDYYGNFDIQLLKTFTVSVLFDKEYIEKFFSELNYTISEHILEKSVPATKVLDFDDRIIDEDAEIPIQNLEKALKLYQSIIKNYPDYSDQLFGATAKILNKNYKNPNTLPFISNDFIDDDDLPF